MCVCCWLCCKMHKYSWASLLREYRITWLQIFVHQQWGADLFVSIKFFGRAACWFYWSASFSCVWHVCDHKLIDFDSVVGSFSFVGLKIEMYKLCKEVMRSYQPSVYSTGWLPVEPAGRLPVKLYRQILAYSRLVSSENQKKTQKDFCLSEHIT